ncbi:MAG: hypothetical protein ACK5PQ_01270 [Alphaproteobacteria bacterium]
MKILNLFIICLPLSGCSVYKAADNQGVDLHDIEKCNTRSCLLSQGLKIIDSRKTPEGQFNETYQGLARKSGVNYLRAGGHAVLDVFTLGLWEVVGTPVEGAISNNRGFWVVRAKYADDMSETVQSMSIYAPNGKQVK